MTDSSQEAAAGNQDQMGEECGMKVALEGTDNQEGVVPARNNEAGQSTELHLEEVAAVPDHTAGDRRCQQKGVEGAAARHPDSNLLAGDMKHRTGAVHKLAVDRTEAEEPGYARRIDYTRAAPTEQHTLH